MTWRSERQRSPKRSDKVIGLGAAGVPAMVLLSFFFRGLHVHTHEDV